MHKRTVFVVNAGVDVGAALARGLASRGHRVALLDDGACASPAGVEHVACGLGTRAALEAAFADGAARCGPPDQVAASVMPAGALQASNIDALDAAQWHATCREPIKGLLHTLQAAFPWLRERGGSVVALGPALSLAGAGRLAALTAAVEGQRGLVKSVARQWGRHGITVNWLAAAPRALSPLFEDLPLPVKPDAVRVALARPPALDAGLAGIVDYLGSPDGRALTGATLMADGGEWMVP